MPNRVVRAALLRSRRFWSVSAEARCLFLAVTLSADDAARFDADPFELSLIMGGTISHERAAELLAECAAVDLLRPYRKNGKAYVFVPRFRQRMRYNNSSKYPEPPKDINDIEEKDGPETVSSQTQDGLKTAEVKRSEVKRSEVNTSNNASTKLPPVARARDPDQSAKAVENSNSENPEPKIPPLTDQAGLERLARSIGLWPDTTGSWEGLRKACIGKLRANYQPSAAVHEGTPASPAGAFATGASRLAAQLKAEGQVGGRPSSPGKPKPRP